MVVFQIKSNTAQFFLKHIIGCLAGLFVPILTDSWLGCHTSTQTEMQDPQHGVWFSCGVNGIYHHSSHVWPEGCFPIRSEGQLLRAQAPLCCSPYIQGARAAHTMGSVCLQAWEHLPSSSNGHAHPYESTERQGMIAAIPGTLHGSFFYPALSLLLLKNQIITWNASKS